MKKIVCIIGPSAIGKSFYAKILMKILNLARPKTITTRNARQDDDNHIYASKKEFLDLVENGRLLEWDEYAGNYYGIMLEEFQKLLLDEENNGVVMDLTLEGCRKVSKAYEEAIVIALLPDDISWLRRRLVERGESCVDEIENRMKISKRDMEMILKMSASIIYCKYDPENTGQLTEKISKAIKKQSKDYSKN